MVVLFGATGYTGRRTAEAMVRRGLRPVLAGRSAGRLTSLAQRLGALGFGKLDVVTADISDATSVRALIGRGDVLVSTVGPFIRLGGAALSAAVDAGAIYLDSTGEPPFIRRVFEEFGPRAQQTGACLITAFGHDYVPGNLAGALALGSSDSAVHRIEIGYLIEGTGRSQVISRGTFASIVGLLTEQSFTWRAGIQSESTGSRMRTFSVGGRNCPALTIGSTEHYSLPRLAGPPGLPKSTSTSAHADLRRARCSCPPESPRRCWRCPERARRFARSASSRRIGSPKSLIHWPWRGLLRTSWASPTTQLAPHWRRCACDLVILTNSPRTCLPGARSGPPSTACPLPEPWAPSKHSAWKR